MPTATYYLEELEISTTRYWPITLNMYEADGETPLAIQVTDNIRFKVWTTDGASPAIECESITPGAGSYVQVLTLGTAGVTPAQVKVHLLQADTGTLVVGTQYHGELILVDDSDSDRAKSMGRFPIRVSGNATGDITL